MTYDPDAFTREMDALISARTLAVQLLASVVGLGLLVSEARRLSNAPDKPESYAYLTLFAIILLLISAWVIGSAHDLRCLLRWLDPKDYSLSELRITAMIAMLAVVLLLLLVAARNPLFFGIAYAVYGVVDLVTTRYLTQQVADALASCTRRLDDEGLPDTLRGYEDTYRRAIRVLHGHFVLLPHGKRQGFVILGAILGTAQAFVAGRTHMEILVVTAYGTFILTILLHEVVMFVWRDSLAGALRPLAHDVKELRRHGGSNALPKGA